MLIRELEQKTGLERATIRFYEKEGLITPTRAENGYRTYGEVDCDTLLKVKLLRQLGMPLERIKELQQGSTDLSDALTEQIAALEKQIQDSSRAREVCLEMKERSGSYNTLDARYYLDVLSRPSSTVPVWKPQPVPEFSRAVPIHPWKRFFARSFDLALFHLLLLFLLVVVFRLRPLNHSIYTVVGIEFVLFLLWIPAEGLMLHYFGTTPGKWIFGIRVESVNGGQLGVSESIKRTWDVLRYGYGFEIPIYNLWRQYQSYKEYKDHHVVRWDQASDSEIQFADHYETRKKILIGVIVIVYLMVSGISVAESIKPPHRGEDLTIAQIAENYNAYMESQIDNPSLSAYMKEDGTFHKALDNSSANGAGVVVVIGTKVLDPDANFEFETENGFVRTITYQQRYTDVLMLHPVGSLQVNMILAVVTAQDWFHIFNYQEFSNNLDRELRKPSGTYIFENIEIRWENKAENCIYTGSFYIDDDDNKPSLVETEFVIIIHDQP